MFSKLFQRSLVPAVYSSRAIVIRHFRESPGVLGEKVDLDVPLGKSLLDTALDQNIDGVLGLCGGEMACSTCHVILPKEYYDKIPQVTEEEQDMLDAAFGVTVTSRLLCRLETTEDLEGIVFHIPQLLNK